MRASGIILHISSLPSPYGIGTLGKAAYNFVDFLKKSGQKYWQVLPIGPTGYGNSPYQSFSVFAGNPYFIDLELLCECSLLAKEECTSIDWSTTDDCVNFEQLFKHRIDLLKKAYCRDVSFNQEKKSKFIEQNSWVEAYALFMALKEKYNLACWNSWDEDIKHRKPEAVGKYRLELSGEVDFWVYTQYLFYSQWKKLKAYANENGIKIIGDAPIYVALDSADAWSNSEMLYFDENKNPIEVAGCPPDAFSTEGQLWGNPLYRWDYLKITGFDWWIKRISVLSQLVDVIRIDHFRGMESYYAIPASEKNAVNGRWRNGPGLELFSAIKNSLGNIEIIAEDLGFLTEDVHKLRNQSGFPGMKVMQFAFAPFQNSDYLPHNHIKNCVVYTGTHDNDTARGWLESAPREQVEFAKKYLNIRDTANFNWDLIRSAWSSVAELSIAQMQDFLNLGSQARMNTPSTSENNWVWRLKQQQLTDELALKIYEITKLYSRA